MLKRELLMAHFSRLQALVEQEPADDAANRHFKAHEAGKVRKSLAFVLILPRPVFIFQKTRICPLHSKKTSKGTITKSKRFCSPFPSISPRLNQNCQSQHLARTATTLEIIRYRTCVANWSSCKESCERSVSVQRSSESPSNVQLQS